MFQNMRHVILFYMFLNPSFKMTTSFANIARTTGDILEQTNKCLFPLLFVITTGVGNP